MRFKAGRKETFMSRRNWGTTASLGAVIATVALLAGLFWPASDKGSSVASANGTSTSTTTVDEGENSDECATPVECLEEKYSTTEGDVEEEAREDRTLDMAQDAEAVARERGYNLDNTTCEHECVLRDGIKGDTASEMAVELLSKGVMSPPLLDDAARYIVSETGRGAGYNDDRPVGDLHKAADDLEIVFEFIDGSDVSRGVIPAGTRRWNTVVQNGQVVQFDYALRKDRVFIRFEKSGVALEFFESCGNRTSENPVPGIPEVPEPPHDDNPPTTTTTVVTTTTVIDVCPNIPGTQTYNPPGTVIRNGRCVRDRSTTTTTQPRDCCCCGGGGTTTTLAPKDPDDDINENDDVPDQERETEPSPDNDDEIREGPTEPRDTPTGCDGPCPTSTTTTTSPSQEDDEEEVTPSCGEAGQPSCSNTGESPPTTTAPAQDAEPDDDPNEGTPNDY
jgi:hypothetical protein